MPELKCNHVDRLFSVKKSPMSNENGSGLTWYGCKWFLSISSYLESKPTFRWQSY